MDIKILGLVRGLFAGNYPDGDENKQLTINNRGDQLVVQALPELTELVRLGGSWQVMLATGIAALTAVPTTVAGLSLWNGEAGGGPCYAIDSFGSVEAVVDATQADPTALFAMNNVAPVAAPTATALTIRGMSGNVYGGKARPVTTLTVTNDGWFPHGAEAQTPLAPAVAGAIWKVNEVKARGQYLVKPGGMFNINAVKLAAAAAQQFFFIRWHEVQIIVR